MASGKTNTPLWLKEGTKAYLKHIATREKIPLSKLITIAIPYLEKEAKKYRESYREICDLIEAKAKEKLEGKAEVLGNEKTIAQ